MLCKARLRRVPQLTQALLLLYAEPTEKRKKGKQSISSKGRSTHPCVLIPQSSVRRIAKSQRRRPFQIYLSGSSAKHLSTPPAAPHISQRHNVNIVRSSPTSPCRPPHPHRMNMSPISKTPPRKLPARNFPSLHPPFLLYANGYPRLMQRAVQCSPVTIFTLSQEGLLRRLFSHPFRIKTSSIPISELQSILFSQMYLVLINSSRKS